MQSGKKRRIIVGPVAQKVILLLAGGLALSVAARPDQFFKIAKALAKEWEAINQRSLAHSIKSLYQSKLIDYKENSDGTVSLILTENGRKKALRYDLDNIKISRPARWDGFWRMVIFDIPENSREGRGALAAKLKQIGFFPIQKSVFIYPFECKNEIDFIVEVFNLRPFVRFIVIKEIDVDLDLKNKFRLR